MCWFRRQIRDSAPTTRSVDLSESLQAEELLEFGFGEDGDAEILGFVVFGAGIGADYDVVGFLADGAGNFAAVLEDEFAGFFAAAIGQPAGEDEGLSGELLAFHFTLFRGRAHSLIAQLLDNFAVRGFGEKLRNTSSHLRPHLRHILQFFRLRRSKLVQRRKMLRQQLPCALSYKLNAQRKNEARERVLLTGANFLQQILRG